MHFALTRFGGIAAITSPPLVVDTQDLPPETAEHIHALARAVSSRGGEATPPSADSSRSRDQFSYSLAITDSGRPMAAVEFDYASANEDIKSLVAALRSASPGSS